MALLNLLYGEMFGDRLQAMHLINCYYRATIKTQSKQICQNSESIVQLQHVVLEGVEYNMLIDDCNETFGQAIRKCYNDFAVIGQPVISRVEVDKMVAKYKTALPFHYKAIHTMMGYHKKKGITKNKHLLSAGYYDRQVFYNLLTMSRQRNPKK